MAESWKKLGKDKYEVSDTVVVRTISKEHLLLEVDILQAQIDNLGLERNQKLADLSKIDALEKDK